MRFVLPLARDCAASLGLRLRSIARACVAFLRGCVAVVGLCLAALLRLCAFALIALARLAARASELIEEAVDPWSPIP